MRITRVEFFQGICTLDYQYKTGYNNFVFRLRCTPYSIRVHAGNESMVVDVKVPHVTFDAIEVIEFETWFGGFFIKHNHDVISLIKKYGKVVA